MLERHGHPNECGVAACYFIPGDSLAHDLLKSEEITMYFSFIHVPKNAVRVGAILMAMMIATASQAIDYFVDQNKSSGESGDGKVSWSRAFMTLEEALGIASAGDTIRVAEGTYTPNDLSLTGDRAQTYLIDKTLV
ncbi:MAG: hypothetical protein IIB54_15385, partial [Planctomycetes bacterium]|nr:hypothetical protein [Planctomycetota bacterium]